MAACSDEPPATGKKERPECLQARRKQQASSCAAQFYVVSNCGAISLPGSRFGFGVRGPGTGVLRHAPRGSLEAPDARGPASKWWEHANVGSKYSCKQLLQLQKIKNTPWGVDFFFFSSLYADDLRFYISATPLPPRLWSLRINPSLPGTCLDFYRDASSALCTPRQPLDRIFRTHAFTLSDRKPQEKVLMLGFEPTNSVLVNYAVIY